VKAKKMFVLNALKNKVIQRLYEVFKRATPYQFDYQLT